MKLKSKYLLRLSLLFILNYGYSQTPYYDALTLNKFITNGKFVTADTSKLRQISEILAHYFIDLPNRNIQVSTIQLQTNKNPYIYSYIKGLTSNDNEKVNITATNLGSSIGGLDMTNIATGLADFLVDRGKEEIELAFFDKMKTSINTDAPELRVIFPKTAVLLDNFDSWQYSNMLNSLRASFNKDLQSVLGNIINLDTIASHNSYSADAKKRINTLRVFFQKPESKILLSALEVGNGIVNQVRIPIIIDSLAAKHFLGGYTDTKDSIVYNAIHFIDIISNSVRSRNANESYVNADTLTISLTKNTDFRNIYIGLLYQQLKNARIRFGSDSVWKLINTGTNTISYIQNAVSAGSSVTAAVISLTSAKKKGEKDLSTYWTAIFQSTDQLLKNLDNTELIDPTLTLPTNVQNVFSEAEQTLTISQDVVNQNYSSALVSLLSLVNDFNQTPLNSSVFATNQAKALSNAKALLSKKRAELKNASKTDRPTISAKIKELTDSIAALAPADQQDITALLKGLAKYVSFASNVVDAKTSDDVKKAIESIALPAGSYSIKRTAKSNFAVNGYIGTGYDNGNPFGIDPSIVALRNRYNTSFSLYAPIGIGYSLGSKCGCGSVTFFVPIIDLGGIANFRLHNDSAALNEQVTLGSIFSPGLTVIYGVPKLPLSFAAGLIYKPTLIYDNSNNTLLDLTSIWRFNLSILIDIPIINIYTKTY